MARVLIRAISCNKIPPFFLSPLNFPHYTSISSLYIHNHPVVHQISSYFDHPCLKRSHLYQIHAQLIISGRLQNPFLCSKLLKLSSQVADLRYTLWVFDGIKIPDIFCVNTVPDIFCVNTVIKAYSHSNLPCEDVSFYFNVVKNGGIKPNSFTFPPLISCCTKSGSVIKGKMCHGQAIKYGFDRVLQIENSMIHMYASCGVIEIALKVFEEMLERDLVTWNSILDGYVKMGDLRTAHKLFDVVPERNVVSWNVMMTGYLEGNNPGCVLKLFREMLGSGLFGNSTTMVSVLAACGRSARLREGASVHGFLVRRLWKFNLIMSTALIDMYSKCRKVEVARSVFDRIQERNLVCWNSMILGHCLHGNTKEGLQLFEDMVLWKKLGSEIEVHVELRSDEPLLLPDEITFIGVLCACVRAGLLEEGRIHFDQMVNMFGLKPNFAHYWCMANLLVSNGLVQEALETVRRGREYVVGTPSESLVWAHLLGSCRFLGDSSLAVQVGKTLIELDPDNSMCYALLLNIYAAAGRWEEAAELRSLMKDRTVGKLPGCSLVDLVEIVHNFEVGHVKEYETEIAALAQTLHDIECDPEQHSMSKTECQT